MAGILPAPSGQMAAPIITCAGLATRRCVRRFERRGGGHRRVQDGDGRWGHPKVAQARPGVEVAGIDLQNFAVAFDGPIPLAGGAEGVGGAESVEHEAQTSPFGAGLFEVRNRRRGEGRHDAGERPNIGLVGAPSADAKAKHGGGHENGESVFGDDGGRLPHTGDTASVPVRARVGLARAILRVVNLADTIAAVATAPGDGAVAMVRVSGPRARDIAAATFRPSSGRPLRARQFTHGHVVDAETGRVVDEAVVAWLPAPRTYTSEPTLEVTCHGGRAATAAVLQAILSAGARVAEPGEFTLRAFLNGRIDLAQAEAVRDAVSASSADAVATAVAQVNGALSRAVREIREPLADLAARIEGSLDFADDGVPDVDRDQAHATLEEVAGRLDALLATAGPGRVRRHGLRVVLAGETNAGKSTLFNALLGSDRAITSDEAGTTRDAIEEVMPVGGLAIVLVDTAGWRLASDAPIGQAERLGVARTEGAVREADVVVHVVDGTSIGDAVAGRERILALAPAAVVIEAWTRADLVRDTQIELAHAAGDGIWVSAVSGQGVEALRSRLFAHASAGGAVADSRVDGEVLTNARHVDALGRARQAVGRATAVVTGGMPDDLLAADVRAAVSACGEVTGETVGDDVLARVFRTFCIGK